MKLLVTLCIAGIAAAANLKQVSNQELFDAMDTDNSGDISHSELTAHNMAYWDGDEEKASKGAATEIEHGDSNDDGKIDFEEFEWLQDHSG